MQRALHNMLIIWAVMDSVQSTSPSPIAATGPVAIAPAQAAAATPPAGRGGAGERGWKEQAPLHPCVHFPTSPLLPLPPALPGPRQASVSVVLSAQHSASGALHTAWLAAQLGFGDRERPGSTRRLSERSVRGKWLGIGRWRVAERRSLTLWVHLALS